MKELLKFEDKPLEIVEKKPHLRLRPLRKLRERRTINTKRETIPTTRGTKRPRKYRIRSGTLPGKCPAKVKKIV